MIEKSFGSGQIIFRPASLASLVSQTQLLLKPEPVSENASADRLVALAPTSWSVLTSTMT